MANPEVVLALRSVRQVLLSGWCKGAYARDAAGLACHYADPLAKSFCLIGAVRAAAGQAPLYERVMGAFNHSKIWLTSMNDAASSVDEVVAYIDGTIGKIQAEQAME
jgi:hypothetical protein